MKGRGVSAQTKITWSAMAVLGCCALGSAAHAQTLQSTLLGPVIPDDYSRGRNVSVTERPRPGYEAPGIQLGAFTAHPSVFLGLGYNDNVLGTQSGKVSDGFAAVDPTITVDSDWSTHELDFAAGARLREYFSQGSENEEGWFVSTNGRLDVNRENAVYGSLGAQRLYEDRSSGSYPTGATAPVAFNLYTASLRASHEGGRIRATLGGDINTFDYDDVRSIDGGLIDQQSRDRTTYRASLKGEYAVSPDTSVYLSTTYGHSSYRLGLSDGLPNRDSDEYRFLTGASFDLTALIRGIIGVGYIYRDYADPRLKSLGGFSVDGELEYFPTQLMTVTLSARRLIEDSVSTDIYGINLNSGGYFNNAVNLRVDYELLRNLLLDARGGVEYDQFNGISQDDTIWNVGAGAKYLVSRTVTLTADVSYVSRDSSGSEPGPRFDETRFLVGVLLRR